VALNEKLLTWRVRPYYLHQGDVAEGTGHLRTPLEAGIAILRQMRGRTSGLAIPHLAVDLPGGGGKVTLGPDWRIDAEGAAGPKGDAPGTWFENYAGERYWYPEAAEADCRCSYDEVFFGGG